MGFVRGSAHFPRGHELRPCSNQLSSGVWLFITQFELQFRLRDDFVSLFDGHGADSGSRFSRFWPGNVHGYVRLALIVGTGALRADVHRGWGAVGRLKLWLTYWLLRNLAVLLDQLCDLDKD